MPLYEFRCPNSHLHELVLPMGSADRSATCPDCGAEAVRLVSAPGLSRLGSSRARLIESTEASAHTPAVVDRLPGSGGGPARAGGDPRHAKLPRP